MTLPRILALALVLILSPAAVRAEPVTATDILGRTVSLAAPARRIVLVQGRQVSTLAFLMRDPTSIVAGWGGDFRRQDPAAYALYQKAFPAVSAIPVVGEGTAPTTSLERIIALQPDLVVLSRLVIGARTATPTSADMIDKLEAAGLKVAVLDFYVRPLVDTVPSLRALGRLTGHGREAEELIAFYEQHLARVRERVAGLPRPTLFMLAHADGRDCCFTPGRATFNDMIEAAGGINLGASLVPGVNGQVSIEKVIASNPDVFVATGGLHLAATNGLVLGPGVDEQRSRESFERLLAIPGIAAVGAVQRGRAYGFHHLFNDTPLHVVGIEVLAKWLHPERFADIDPQRSFDEMNRRFLTVPVTGTWWLGAPPP
ncbi:ABC transporter substrate-binding protein [Phreatobacter sp. AB_2022a]|uniref:ABC transporter substrate-binding protein n=1 Tax=Phreatobacter sp. AB_2022a TaxID=3003134 RepID=UPI002286D714|nr:ABC transporter substrate-binding protein [Phreatobacter sp. AB_2022a]MCZ0736337.1 ABC transporter substrate-binding protein [Phreatobacter sp. AB_2022a]